MTKLYEILAVVGDLQTVSKKVGEETTGTFNKKNELFIGTVTETKHFSEADSVLDTTEEKTLVTTVFEKLKYQVRANVRALDAYFQKECANQKAKADIDVDGVIIAKDVPATALLGLETKLAELRAVYLAIPTLAPGPEWEIDSEQRPGVYKSRHPETRFRTRKTMRAFELSKATEHHPAQVQAITEDTAIAKITVQTWSGMISSGQKSQLLDRIDGLIRAVKKARQRANAEIVDPTRKIGDALFEHIHAGIVV
jgi:hypothetical protein